MSHNLMDVRTPGTNMIPCAKTISWSTLTKDNGSIPLPRARLDWILLSAKYNVTDAGISAGETFFGALDRVQIGESGARIVTFESNEIDALIALMNNGLTTGVYNDPLPATTVDAYAYALLKGPFQLSGMSQPEIFAEIGAITDEWGAASAFTAQLSAMVLLSDNQDAPGYFYERQYRPTSLHHVVSGLGPGLVEDVSITGAATTNTSRVTVDFGDGRSPLSFDRPYELNQVNSASRNAVGTTTFLLENLDMPVASQREIVVENSSTDTLLALIKNIVSA